MKLHSAINVLLAFTTLASSSTISSAFVVPNTSSVNYQSPRVSSSLSVVAVSDNASTDAKLKVAFKNAPGKNRKFNKIVQKLFQGALPNVDLVTSVVKILDEKGSTGSNTLVATSLCCDELARRLEDDLVKIYGNNFNLGGLSGFPFAGNTGFGAMAAHIPDDGYCLVVYGPHVGVAADGTVGKVERKGIRLIDTCCGSAVAASNRLAGITDGGLGMTIPQTKFGDFQQGAVQELLLPHGARLASAKNRMTELPRALYDSQDLLVADIVRAGAKGIKKGGLALLGGIQINTGPKTSDYFLPLRFDFMNSNGDVLEDLLPKLEKKGFVGKVKTKVKGLFSREKKD